MSRKLPIFTLGVEEEYVLLKKVKRKKIFKLYNFY